MEKYFLGEACKNTFIILDSLTKKSVSNNFLSKVHKCLMKEQRDDSLILTNGQKKKDSLYANMIVFGQDATLGEFCGNGSRACAAYLFDSYKEFDKFFLVTKRGIHQLKKYGNGIYSIQLSPVLFEINKKFINKFDLFQKKGSFYELSLKGKTFFYAEAIEPHLILKEDLSNDELYQLGTYLNKRRDIFPLGINLNAYHVLEENKKLFVKTYERGVLRLTLSCGTGSSSCTAHYLSGKKGNIKVETPGGLLEIASDKNGFELKGPAKVEKTPLSF